MGVSFCHAALHQFKKDVYSCTSKAVEKLSLPLTCAEPLCMVRAINVLAKPCYRQGACEALLAKVGCNAIMSDRAMCHAAEKIETATMQDSNLELAAVTNVSKPTELMLDRSLPNTSKLSPVLPNGTFAAHDEVMMILLMGSTKVTSMENIGGAYQASTRLSAAVSGLQEVTPNEFISHLGAMAAPTFLVTGLAAS